MKCCDHNSWEPLVCLLRTLLCHFVAMMWTIPNKRILCLSNIDLAISLECLIFLSLEREELREGEKILNISLKAVFPLLG